MIRSTCLATLALAGLLGATPAFSSETANSLDSTGTFSTPATTSPAATPNNADTNPSPAPAES